MKKGEGIVDTHIYIGGYQYILSLNGGTWADKVQSAQVFLECDESGSKVVEKERMDLLGNREIHTCVVGQAI